MKERFQKNFLWNSSWLASRCLYCGHYQLFLKSPRLSEISLITLNAWITHEILKVSPCFRNKFYFVELRCWPGNFHSRQQNARKNFNLNIGNAPCYASRPYFLTTNFLTARILLQVMLKGIIKRMLKKLYEMKLLLCWKICYTFHHNVFKASYAFQESKQLNFCNFL